MKPQAGPPLPLWGGADDLLLRVVVGRGRLLVHIQPGETLRPLPVALVLGISQTEQIEIDVALGLVELVVAPLVLVVDWSQPGQLAGDGVPLALAEGEQMRAAAQQIEQRPVVAALVEIVPAVAGVLPGVAPDQFAVWVGVFFQKGVDRVVHHIDQLAFQHGPGGWLGQGDAGGDGKIGGRHGLNLLMGCVRTNDRELFAVTSSYDSKHSGKWVVMAWTKVSSSSWDV